MSLGELNPKSNGRNIAGCMRLIESHSLSASTASTTFSNIPSSFNHLQIRGIARTDYGNNYDYVAVSFNGDYGYANCSYEAFEADGTTAAILNSSSFGYIQAGFIAGGSTTANYAGAFVFNFPFYTNNSFFKNMNFISGNVGGSFFAAGSGQWFKAAIQTISSITLQPSLGSNFVAGTSFSLYGIT